MSGDNHAKRLRLWASRVDEVFRPLQAIHLREAADHVEALEGEVERLRGALEEVRDWIRHDLEVPTYGATTMLGSVLSALSRLRGDGGTEVKQGSDGIPEAAQPSAATSLNSDPKQVKP